MNIHYLECKGNTSLKGECSGRCHNLKKKKKDHDLPPRYPNVLSSHSIIGMLHKKRKHKNTSKLLTFNKFCFYIVL